MVSIVWSVLSIALIIGVGWAARRGGALGPESAGSLAAATYWVASPAMLFHAIVSTGTSGVFGAPLAVAAASGVGTALLFVAVARLFLRLTRGEIALGAMASSLNNGAYIGIPIAVYVLNDASAVVPILVFQLGFFTPMFFVLADLVGSGQRPSIVGVARVVARNPMVIAAVCGFLFSAVGWPMPTLLDVSTSPDDSFVVRCLARGSTFGVRGFRYCCDHLRHRWQARPSTRDCVRRRDAARSDRSRAHVGDQHGGAALRAERLPRCVACQGGGAERAGNGPRDDFRVASRCRWYCSAFPRLGARGLTVSSIV